MSAYDHPPSCPPFPSTANSPLSSPPLSSIAVHVLLSNYLTISYIHQLDCTRLFSRFVPSVYSNGLSNRSFLICPFSKLDSAGPIHVTARFDTWPSRSPPLSFRFLLFSSSLRAYCPHLTTSLRPFPLFFSSPHSQLQRNKRQPLAPHFTTSSCSHDYTLDDYPPSNDFITSSPATSLLASNNELSCFCLLSSDSHIPRPLRHCHGRAWLPAEPFLRNCSTRPRRNRHRSRRASLTRTTRAG